MAVNPGDPDMAALSTGENLAGNYLFHLFWKWRTASAVRHFHFTIFTSLFFAQLSCEIVV
jgi:hypothetical protein